MDQIILFKPTAQAEIRVSCPHCMMINEIDLKFVKTQDRPEASDHKCKRCLKGFQLVLWLHAMINIHKNE